MKTLGELELISALTRSLKMKTDVVAGPGDDCAVTRVMPGCRNDILLTTDPISENIHFKPGTEPARIGNKVVGRVLSDIAAMGGKPRWILINLAGTTRQTSAFFVKLYEGANSLAARHGASIVGGDISAAPSFQIHAFGVGTVPHGKAVLRSGAKKGDLICVTGALGASSLGRHLDFEPRVREGIFLRDWATSMIDISDGLATDIRHIIRTGGIDAILRPDQIPITEDARCMKGKPIDHALSDGEDYELLFTLRESDLAEFERKWKRRFKLPCTVIGSIAGGKGRIFLDTAGARKIYANTGFEHFKAAGK